MSKPKASTPKEKVQPAPAERTIEQLRDGRFAIKTGDKINAIYNSRVAAEKDMNA